MYVYTYVFTYTSSYKTFLENHFGMSEFAQRHAHRLSHDFCTSVTICGYVCFNFLNMTRSTGSCVNECVFVCNSLLFAVESIISNKKCLVAVFKNYTKTSIILLLILYLYFFYYLKFLTIFELDFLTILLEHIVPNHSITNIWCHQYNFFLFC